MDVDETKSYCSGIVWTFLIRLRVSPFILCQANQWSAWALCDCKRLRIDYWLQTIFLPFLLIFFFNCCILIPNISFPLLKKVMESNLCVLMQLHWVRNLDCSSSNWNLFFQLALINYFLAKISLRNPELEPLFQLCNSQTRTSALYRVWNVADSHFTILKKWSNSTKNIAVHHFCKNKMILIQH